MAINPINFIEVLSGKSPEVSSVKSEKQLSYVERGRSDVMNQAANLLIDIVDAVVPKAAELTSEITVTETKAESVNNSKPIAGQSMAYDQTVVTAEDVAKLKQEMNLADPTDAIRAQIAKIYAENDNSTINQPQNKDLSLGA